MHTVTLYVYMGEISAFCPIFLRNVPTHSLAPTLTLLSDVDLHLRVRPISIPEVINCLLYGKSDSKNVGMRIGKVYCMTYQCLTASGGIEIG